MQVQLDTAVSNIGETQPGPAESKVSRVQPAQNKPSTEKESNVQKQESVSAAAISPDVTFRRDRTGRIYYVVTDATSGKELREVPAKEVRSVGEGIEEFLKKESGLTSHVEVKA